MCCKVISICFILIVNICVLLLCIAGLALTGWAQATSKLDEFNGLTGFNVSQLKYIYYVCYAIFGGLALICILGIVACCCCQKVCMCIYAILLIILSIVFIIILLAWCILFAVVLSKLKGNLETLLYGYESEYATNDESIIFNILQIVFGACGVESYKDYNDAKKCPDWQNTVKDSTREQLLGDSD
ncbi:uncharacterized protein LOC134846757 [Symsagittifera roscoffensis]|uniref:uncharacterized protein LOC134846757 n=1 Tax=Symsagittifera roscoffensis TaxID=84072 RepID=UPI00307C3004